MKESDEIILTQRVLGTEEGQKLLDQWVSVTINNPNMYDDNSNKVLWRTGQLDMINRIRLFVTMSQEDLHKLMKHEDRQESLLAKMLNEKLTETNEFGDIIP